MLIRISLIVAIVAGLAVAGLNFFKVKDQIDTLVKDRDTQKEGFETTTKNLNATNKVLKAVAADLKTTKDQLTSATEERDSAKSEATAAVKRADDLAENLKKTQTERESALAKLAAWDAVGVPMESVKGMKAQIVKLTGERNEFGDENRILLSKVTRLNTELAQIKDPDGVEVVEPAGLKGKVLVADPKYDFVVLNIGEKEGVQNYGKLLVNRNGKLIAKVKISSVQADRCIANVMPGWKVDDVMEGDQVLY